MRYIVCLVLCLYLAVTLWADSVVITDKNFGCMLDMPKVRNTRIQNPGLADGRLTCTVGCENWRSETRPLDSRLSSERCQHGGSGTDAAWAHRGPRWSSRVFQQTARRAPLLYFSRNCAGRSHPVISHITGIGFERYYPYLVLFLTFHRDWRVSEHDASSSYRGFGDLFFI